MESSASDEPAGVLDVGPVGNEGNHLRVFIAQIRKKLDPTPERPRYSITGPHIGYRLDHAISRGGAE